MVSSVDLCKGHTFPIPVVASSSAKDQMASVRQSKIRPKLSPIRSSICESLSRSRIRSTQSHLCNRSHHFCYRSHGASSVRSAQEYYTSRNGEYRNSTEKWAYIFHYQFPERVRDKDDGPIPLREFELSINFVTIASNSLHPFSSHATILAPN